MKRSVLFALFAAFAVQPMLAAAQPLDRTPLDQEYMKFVSASPGVPGNFPVGSAPYLGPYTAQFRDYGGPTSAQFSIYCVDYYHGAKSQWVDATSLGAASPDGTGLDKTREGASAASYVKYSRAVYLSSMFLPTQGDPDQVGIWSALHAAIWTIMTGSPIGAPANTWALRDGFLAASQDAFDNGDIDTKNWYVLSSANGPDHWGRDGQEYLVNVVPEPSTYILMGTGLLLLLAFGRKRMADLIETEDT